MLTREQKIDFLKCCIAAYEHERFSMTDPYGCFIGFCLLMKMFQIFHNRHGGMDTLKDEFQDFYNFIESRWDLEGDGRYYFPTTRDGVLQRAKVAREFLKSEYGIDY